MPKPENKPEPKVDDLGVEIDDDIERLRSDPKTATFDKYLDYRERRKKKVEEIAKQKEEEEARNNKKSFWD